MKAIRCIRYGAPDVLRLVELEKPVPGDHEVLIRVQASTVTPSDCAFRSGKPFMARFFTGLLRPRHIPGDVLAGTVEAVGPAVQQLRPGDRVFGSSGPTFGAQAEYRCLGEAEALATMPARLSFGEAAAVSDGGLTALPFLRDKARLRPGQTILINGASGSVGTVAVQLARHYGAEVTGVCSTANLDLVRSLGAATVIDYTREDFTRTGRTYDVIFDAVGKSSYARCRGALNEGGLYLTTVPTMSILIRMLLTSRSRRRRAGFAATGLRPPGEKKQDLAYLSGLIEAGQLRAVIDRHYPLDQIAEAHRYVELGHKKGNVVLDV